MKQNDFENIAYSLRQRAVTVARRYRLDSESAEDIAQDTVMKLWMLRDDLADPKRTEALAATIARNLSIDKLRRQRTVSIDESCRDEGDSRFNQPDALLESNENTAWLEQEMRRLPSTEYAVLQLRQVERKSTAEIASILGIKPNSVAALLARARKRLLTEMTKRI